MAWIKIVNEGDATGDLAEVYSEKRKQGLWKELPEGEACFSTPFSVFTNNGTALKWFDLWQKAARFGKSDLSRTQREMIATVTSRLNDCVF